MANRYARTAGGNWSVASTWASTSGGTESVAAPNAGDAVYLDANSGNVTVNTTTCVGDSLNCSGYTGVLTFTAGQKLAIDNTTTLAGGMTITGTGTLQLNDTASITSNGATMSGDIIFAGGTWTLVDDWLVIGSVQSTTANVTLNGNTLYIGGGLTVTRLLAGTTALNMFDTGTITTASTSNYLRSNITIASSGTITFSGSIYYGNGTMTYTSGTVVTTGSILYSEDSSAEPTFTTDGIIWNDVNFDGDDFTLGSDLACSGTLYLGDCTSTGAFDITCGGLNVVGHIFGANNTTLSGDIYCNGDALFDDAGAAIDMIGAFTIYITGDLSVTVSVTSSGTGIELTGTGAWTHSAGASCACPLTINTAGTITISGTIMPDDITYTAGTVVTTGSQLYIANNVTLDTNGMVWNNIYFVGTTTVTLASDLTLDGDWLQAGTLSGNYAVIFTANNTHTIDDSTIFYNLTFGAGSTIHLTSGTTQTISNTFIATGTAEAYITIDATTPGTEAHLSKASGVVSCDYLDLTDNHATGGATWNAGHAIDNGNVDGWGFTVLVVAVSSLSLTGALGNPTESFDMGFGVGTVVMLGAVQTPTELFDYVVDTISAIAITMSLKDPAEVYDYTTSVTVLELALTLADPTYTYDANIYPDSLRMLVNTFSEKKTTLTPAHKQAKVGVGCWFCGSSEGW